MVLGDSHALACFCPQRALPQLTTAHPRLPMLVSAPSGGSTVGQSGRPQRQGALGERPAWAGDDMRLNKLTKPWPTRALFALILTML